MVFQKEELRQNLHFETVEAQPTSITEEECFQSLTVQERERGQRDIQDPIDSRIIGTLPGINAKGTNQQYEDSILVKGMNQCYQEIHESIFGIIRIAMLRCKDCFEKEK